MFIELFLRMFCLQLVSVCEREKEGEREKGRTGKKSEKKGKQTERESEREREGLTVDHVIVLSENF